MTSTEFEKIWRLLSSLFPAAAAKKSSLDIAVWKKALEDYSMDDVSNSVMEYAKKNKFFPDLADITRMLLGEYPVDDKAVIQTATLYARLTNQEAPDFQTKDEALAWFREHKKETDDE